MSDRMGGCGAVEDRREDGERTKMRAREAAPKFGTHTKKKRKKKREESEGHPSLFVVCARPYVSRTFHRTWPEARE